MGKCPLQIPAFTIAKNAGVDGSVVVGRLLEQDDMNMGYDAAKGTVFQYQSSSSLLSDFSLVSVAIMKMGR